MPKKDNFIKRVSLNIGLQIDKGLLFFDKTKLAVSEFIKAYDYKNPKFILCVVLMVLFIFSFVLAFNQSAGENMACLISEFNLSIVKTGNKTIVGAEDFIFNQSQKAIELANSVKKEKVRNILKGVEAKSKELGQFPYKAINLTFSAPSFLASSAINLIVNSKITHKYIYRRVNKANEQIKQKLILKLKSIFDNISY
ncbi:hypothetical protein ACFLZ0_00225 [Patescibacteria group bacterium]